MPKNLHQAVLLFGSNLGDREANIQNASKALESWADGKLSHSSLYASPSWGAEGQPDYLNQVVMMETWLDPEELLFRCLEVEKKLGRERTVQYASRTIDIDILFFDDLILNIDGLTIPHPRLEFRRFTLLPLCELMADHIHPVLKKSMKELLANCKDAANVVIY